MKEEGKEKTRVGWVFMMSMRFKHVGMAPNLAFSFFCYSSKLFVNPPPNSSFPRLISKFIGISKLELETLRIVNGSFIFVATKTARRK